MDIRLKPQLGKLVEQYVQRGPYETADEFVERGVLLLHEHESWLAENATEIVRKISEGYAAARRGGLMDAEEVRPGIEQKKSVGFDDKLKV
jgi:Arc/MetJ-type ribon-helix-helix transcriptional regulator